MADMKDLTPDLDRLDSHIDDLEEALQPLIKDLEGVASRLPLLDKAKLFSLSAYAIESLLFCACLPELIRDYQLTDGAASLRLQGQDAQTHPVYTELKRVQQYFSKIKAIEEPEGQRSHTVNQEAAARMLKADLVRLVFPSALLPHLIASQGDNKDVSSKLAEKIAEERAKALLKSVESQSSKKSKKRPAEDSTPASGSAGEGQETKKQKHKNKGKKKKGSN